MTTLRIALALTVLGFAARSYANESTRQVSGRAGAHRHHASAVEIDEDAIRARAIIKYEARRTAGLDGNAEMDYAMAKSELIAEKSANLKLAANQARAPKKDAGLELGGGWTTREAGGPQ